jgi:hypothetical protein
VKGVSGEGLECGRDDWETVKGTVKGVLEGAWVAGWRRLGDDDSVN